MKIGDGTTKTEFLITKREPLLMYSRSDNESDEDKSNNSSFCSHNDYDQHDHQRGATETRADDNEIPSLPTWREEGHQHNDFEVDSDGCENNDQTLFLDKETRMQITIERFKYEASRISMFGSSSFIFTNVGIKSSSSLYN